MCENAEPLVAGFFLQLYPLCLLAIIWETFWARKSLNFSVSTPFSPSRGSKSKSSEAGFRNCSSTNYEVVGSNFVAKDDTQLFPKCLIL